MFRNVPPIGLGMIPLLVTFASPVQISATLFCAQSSISFRTPLRVCSIILFFDSLKNLVRLLTTEALCFVSLIQSIQKFVLLLLIGAADCRLSE